MTNAVFVKNANRMITAAGLTEQGLELRFEDGLGGTIPFADIPEVSGPEALTGLELANPYDLALATQTPRGSKFLGISRAATAMRPTVK